MDSICSLHKISLKYFFLVLVLSVFSGCITDSLDDCPADKSLIYIRIVDILTNQDVTTYTEDIETLTLYLFDREKKYVRSYDFTPHEIHNRIPIEVTDTDLEGYYVTVWANLNEERDDIPEVKTGDVLENLLISLKINTEQEGFFLCPGDLFFGHTQLSFTEKRINYQTIKEATVDVKRKNAKLYVTVRGLQYNVDNETYYFRINSSPSAYNFAGTPMSSLTRDIRELGIFNTLNDFVSPEPYFMIHSPLTETRDTNSSISIHLYNAKSNVEIISANKDIGGNNIKLESGKTTNVLMEITGSGDMQVQIIVTDWDEIYQWTENW